VPPLPAQSPHSLLTYSSSFLAHSLIPPSSLPPSSHTHTKGACLHTHTLLTPHHHHPTTTHIHKGARTSTWCSPPCWATSWSSTSSSRSAPGVAAARGTFSRRPWRRGWVRIGWRDGGIYIYICVCMGWLGCLVCHVWAGLSFGFGFVGWVCWVVCSGLALVLILVLFYCDCGG
jgi:hypothetical protein